MRHEGTAKCDGKVIALTSELWAIVDIARQYEDFELGRAAWIEDRLWELEIVQRIAKRRKIKRPDRGTWGRDNRGNGKLKVT